MASISRGLSVGWWGLVLCLSLVVGAHFVFDILHVDGSDPQSRTLTDPMSSPASFIEVRPLPLELQSTAWRANSSLLLFPEPQKLFTPWYESLTAPAHVSIVWRVHMIRLLRVKSAPTDDPVTSPMHAV